MFHNQCLIFSSCYPDFIYFNQNDYLNFSVLMSLFTTHALFIYFVINIHQLHLKICNKLKPSKCHSSLIKLKKHEQIKVIFFQLNRHYQNKIKILQNLIDFSGKKLYLEYSLCILILLFTHLRMAKTLQVLILFLFFFSDILNHLILTNRCVCLYPPRTLYISS